MSTRRSAAPRLDKALEGTAAVDWERCPTGLELELGPGPAEYSRRWEGADAGPTSEEEKVTSTEI
jgi:hypothetical protein